MIRLYQILNKLLDTSAPKDDLSDVCSCLQNLASTFGCDYEECIKEIRIDSDSDEDVSYFLKNIQQETECPELRPFLSYLTDELVCNVQQHANVTMAYGFSFFDKSSKRLFLGIADGGRTIYGSYVKAQRYLEEIGNNEANSLYFAQKGYSTKNLPDAENRGYGISSNARIVVECLSGCFAIISGNAMSYRDIDENNFYDLPKAIEWPGTLVLAEIPLTNKNIDLYKYIY